MQLIEKFCAKCSADLKYLLTFWLSDGHVLGQNVWNQKTIDKIFISDTTAGSISTFGDGWHIAFCSYQSSTFLVVFNVLALRKEGLGGQNCQFALCCCSNATLGCGRILWVSRHVVVLFCFIVDPLVLFFLVLCSLKWFRDSVPYTGTVVHISRWFCK